MIDRKWLIGAVAPKVFVDQNEGGAGNGIRNLERLTDGLNETSLPAPEIPDQAHNRPWHQALSQSTAKGAGLFR